MKVNRIGVIAKKLCMSQVFQANGLVIPVTIIMVAENVVLSTKKIAEGMSSIQLAAFEQKAHRVSKSVASIFEKAKLAPRKKIKEFIIKGCRDFEVGNKIDVQCFKKGQYIDVTGTSIGKGFAGVMKRHNFKGLEASHGVSASHRSHGSTGQCQDPGKVFKGKKMAGQMGNKRVTVQNVKVIDIDSSLDLLIVRGAVPGSKNGYLYIRDAIKKITPY